MKNICHGLFGLPIDYKVPTIETNARYGSRSILNNTERIIFTNGGRDPWSVLSVPSILISNDYVSESIQHETDKSYRVEEVGHCADLSHNRVGNPLLLVKERHLVSKEIESWLYN